VCSGRGTCVAPDKCECQQDWQGEQCNITQCFGIFGNDSQVCNGHGDCVNIDKCDCEIGWGGDECSVAVNICYGKSETDPTVCSGRGTCFDINQCKCNSRYTGKDCGTNRLIIVYANTATSLWNWMCIMIVLLLFIIL
jgi:hypothetical protein